MDSLLRPTVPPSVSLAELAQGLDLTGEAPAQVRVSGITNDSREVQPGWIYVALPGARVHGAQFAAQAAEAGAAAILTDERGAELARPSNIPVLRSGDVRHAMAIVSARVFGEPAAAMTMLGVTGTNGKTTTVALLQAGLAAHEKLAGTIGTIGFRLGDRALRSSRSTVTTPEAPDLQGLLAVMREDGADAVALEVSSHALALGRADGIVFDAVGFLNLGRDHLDFHHSVEAYFEAKARLFEPGRARVSVIWVDDPAGAELAERVRAHGRSQLVTVGTGEQADYRLAEYHDLPALAGAATVVRRGESVSLELGLPGRYNMIDAVVALAMLESVGVPTSAAVAGLKAARVPGRMQRVDLGEGAPIVVVDFAHTPQAVGAAVESLSAEGEVITVVGCGGDRDAAKRPEMGAAAARGSKLTIITDDNPRTEDPAQIRAATLAGARSVPGAEVMEVAGRRAAIAEALKRAAPGNVVAILGKGHERGQILATETVDFDDVEEAAEQWRLLTEGGHPHACDNHG